MVTKLSLLQKSGQGKRLGWQPPETNTTEHTTPRQEIQMPQARCSQTLNYQRCQNSQKPNQGTQIDWYLSQTRICKQWEVEMERLNAKYNLDCFSDSELNSESDDGEQYKYEHGYETLV